jgi:3-oxoacyl-[acyl-carrier protein] reductase
VDLGLRGRVALVTAASKGLGRASALALADEGASVAICARGADALRRTEQDLAARTDDVLATVADVTETDAPRRLVDATVERFGRLDIVVANAGGPPAGRALDVDDDALRSALEANFLTSVRLVREAVPHMGERGWGRICLITSFSVKQPIPTLALSNSARTALWAWAKTAASDLFDEGITLNLACPGHHATDRMKELGTTSDRPFGDPADFGRVVAFLCSEPAGYVSGTALQVDGAQTAGLL